MQIHETDFIRERCASIDVECYVIVDAQGNRVVWIHDVDASRFVCFIRLQEFKAWIGIE